ncbi:uncharacterized [Tachysurus ichikawai]
MVEPTPQPVNKNIAQLQHHHFGQQMHVRRQGGVRGSYGNLIRAAAVSVHTHRKEERTAQPGRQALCSSGSLRRCLFFQIPCEDHQKLSQLGLMMLPG